MKAQCEAVDLTDWGEGVEIADDDAPIGVLAHIGFSLRGGVLTLEIASELGAKRLLMSPESFLGALRAATPDAWTDLDRLGDSE